MPPYRPSRTSTECRLDRVPKSPAAQPLDLRIVIVFGALVVGLVAPSVPPVLSPLDGVELHHIAGSLDSDAREAVAVIGTRGHTTPIAFASELTDIGASADEVSGQLLRTPAASGSEGLRTRLEDAATSLADAVDQASVAYDDPGRLETSGASVAKVRAALDAISGS